MSKRALPEFQKHLLSRNLVKEKNVQFYASAPKSPLDNLYADKQL
jgi:hypothetical protein